MRILFLNRRKEREYLKHRTTGLMEAVNVAKEDILNHRLYPTRNEEVFLAFMEHTVARFPKQEEIVIMADHLNTHQSESLVRWVARPNRR